uniref:Cell cycle protein n=1 Tax=uncultured Chloroflexota bacterium TaxID=166587 RepID=H5SMY1_9CHLR|nr:cell cycle protein [uncultured Chloroflexota bacterium]
MFRGFSWRFFDFSLLGAVIIAIIFGVMMIRSAVAGNEEIAPSVNRQIIYASIGLAVLFFAAAMDYHYWDALRLPMYLATMFLLILLFMSARAVFGAARWFQIGQIFIQPTELTKIVVILLLARYFERTQDRRHDLRWVFGSFFWVGTLAIWILLQPNLSNVIVLIVLWMTLLWLSGLDWKYLVAFALGGMILAVVSFPFLRPYQQQRVLNFLFPDPNARHGAVYNVLQALIAIGSGGLTGKGYGQGTQVQLRFLKVRHTDFVFSTVAEEFGLVGVLFILGLLSFIVFRCLHIARHAPDLMGKLIASGVATLIFFQGAVNIGVNLNVIPVAGLPLPFISYGGSGLLSLMLGIGLVESVAIRSRRE